jgi:hypothetical protein
MVLACFSWGNLIKRAIVQSATPRVAHPCMHERALVAWRGFTNGTVLVQIPPKKECYKKRCCYDYYCFAGKPSA